MKVIQTGIPGLVEIWPDIIQDNRGYFYEIYNRERYFAAGITNEFCQENQSKSTYGVIRGLHFQSDPFSQAKLAMAMEGQVLDVAVDLRKGSPTYGQWRSVVLDAEKHNQFLIPKGFAHGLSVLSESAIFSYRCDNVYHPESEGGIAFDDPQLNIDWRIPQEKQIVSEKDKHRPSLVDVDANFIY